MHNNTHIKHKHARSRAHKPLHLKLETSLPQPPIHPPPWLPHLPAMKRTKTAGKTAANTGRKGERGLILAQLGSA